MACLGVLAGFFVVGWALIGAIYWLVRDDGDLCEDLQWTSIWSAMTSNYYRALGFLHFGHLRYGHAAVSVLCLVLVVWEAVFLWWILRHTPCET